MGVRVEPICENTIRSSLFMKSEVVYSSESVIKQPGRLWTAMWCDLAASRELAFRFMMRDLRAQYRDSFLGWLWALIPPFAMAAGFTLATRSGIMVVGWTSLPYPAYVFFSMVLWQTFLESLNAPIQAVQLARPMLARINFPREALLMGKLGEILVQMAIKVVLVGAVFWWYQVPVSFSAVFALPALLPLIGLGFLFGMLLAPFGVLSQDISRGVALVSGFWLLVTPVVYPMPQGRDAFSSLVRWNPVTPLLVTVRELATTGQVSDLTGYAVVSGGVLVAILLAWVVYRAAMPFVVERVGA